MKKLLLIIIFCFIPFRLAFSQDYPISEKKAISIITNNVLFRVYNDYLKNKYNVIHTYKTEIKEMSIENDSLNTFYVLTFYNKIKNIENGDVTSITFRINVFSGIVEIVQPIFLMDDEFRKFNENPEEYVKNYFKEKIN